jgi:prolyl-tRNA synthetase
VHPLIASLKKLNISVKFDNRTTQKPGFKFAEWELKGVPIRVAVGPKDLENGTFEIARRDTLTKEVVTKDGIVAYISDLLEKIQSDLFSKALQYRDAHITEVENFDQFKEVLERKGGFVSAHWDGTAATEEKIKDLTKATIRCIPLNSIPQTGSCVFSGEKSMGRVLFAKAY